MSLGSILVADDDAAIRTVLNQALSRAGYDVRITSNAATLWRWISAGDGDLVITDVVMPDENAFDLLPRIKKSRPDLPVIVMSAQNTFMTAIRASEAGAYEYLPKPFDLTELVSIVGRALAEPKKKPEKWANDEQPDTMPLVGRSPAMQDIYRVLARMMQTDLTVMISGESGTGKELVARALHEYGRRRKGPFVAINMAAIPRDLIESELFGHERGAFTGAQNRSSGRFEQADGGTLFLDEIGDMPMEAQTRLLRVLQQGEYIRQRRVVIFVELDVAGKAVLGDGFDVIQHNVDVHRLPFDRALVGKHFHAVDKRDNPVGLVGDQPRQRAVIIVETGFQ